MLNLVLALILIGPQQPPKGDAGPLLQKTLFAGDKWYQEAKGEEREFEGLLEMQPTQGRIGLPPRFCAFRLSWVAEDGKAHSLPIYMNGKDALLGPFVGYRVRLTAKTVESDAGDAKVRELWPARLEALELAPFGVIGDLKILARTHAWSPSGITRQQYPVPFVIRDPRDLAQRLNLGNVPNAEQVASNQLAGLLGLVGPQARIDWQTQMLICISSGNRYGGARTEVARVAVQEKTLDVYWRIVAGDSLPVETILVKRFDGDIRFHQLGATTKPIVIPAVGKEEEKK